MNRTKISVALMGLATLALAISMERLKPPTPTLPTQPQLEMPGSKIADREQVGWIVVIAFLRTTAYAEGVWPKPGVNSYRTQSLSYRQIPLDYAYKDHPYWHDKIIPCTPDGTLCSACTGAYQWHPDTYAMVRKEFAHKFWFDDGAFSPRNQDLAAIYWMDKYGMWEALYKELRIFDGKVVVQRASFQQALKNGSSQWAPFPRHEDDTVGGLGQSAQSTEKLWKFFNKQLEELQR